MAAFKTFVKLRKGPLLTANIVKSAVSGLRQFLAVMTPQPGYKTITIHILPNISRCIKTTRQSNLVS